MISKENILASAKKTILSQSESVAQLTQYLTDDFAKAVQIIYQTNGRVVVTGIGKSAIIAQKMVATFNSTGTPAMFLHAAEAIHGDLGMVQQNDVIICISKSGNSPEIKVLTPLLKRFGNPLIGITANLDSFLAKQSDMVLNAFVQKESCPNNLAPTNSTTVQLVLGDALAVCLMEMRNFTSTDFAKYHPGGALGKKLLLRVNNILDTTHKPIVTTQSSIKDVIVEISKNRLGVTAVLEQEKLVGIITDGDIRRMLNQNETIAGIKAQDIMSKNPKTVNTDAMVIDAFHVMENFSITQLVVCQQDKYVGILHIHDILKEGII